MTTPLRSRQIVSLSAVAVCLCSLLSRTANAAPDSRIASLIDPKYKSERDYGLRLKSAFDVLSQRYRQLPATQRPPMLDYLADNGYPVPLWPAPGWECLDSETLPVSVCHRTSEDHLFARKVLTTAEVAWQKQVVEMGFAAPSTSANNEALRVGIDIFIDEILPSNPPYSAYGSAVPYDANPDTPINDCLSFMWIGAFGDYEHVNDEELQLLVHHEFHHSIQAATDCSENLFSAEAGAQWMQAQFGPTDALTVGPEILSLYQSNPNYPLVYWSQTPALWGYQYGGFLFLQFVQEHLGNKDSSTIRLLWDGTVQPATKEKNEPDLLDALLETTKASGVTWKDIMTSFGEWRYFVGQNDDGKHFEYAKYYAPIKPDRVSLSSLLDGEIQRTMPEIYELGYAYMQLDQLPKLVDKDLSISVTADDPGIDWDYKVYSLKDKVVVSQASATLGPSGARELKLSVVAASDAQSLLVVLSDFGRPDLDMDDFEQYTSTTFHISVAAVEHVQQTLEDSGTGGSSADASYPEASSPPVVDATTEGRSGDSSPVSTDSSLPDAALSTADGAAGGGVASADSASGEGSGCDCALAGANEARERWPPMLVLATVSGMLRKRRRRRSTQP